MSESFEDEVRSALRSGVVDDLTVGGLADGARAKARTRRRTWSGALAAAVVVAAVPVGLAALNSGGGPGGATTVGTFESAADGLPEGWHWEAWDGVEIGVPDGWRAGALNQWCVSGGPDSAAIQRPDTMQTLVFCEGPLNGYGVQFDPEGTPKNPGEVWQYTEGDQFPHNAWIANLGNASGEVLVVAPDRATAETMTGSFQAIEGADANGCAPRQDIPRIGTAPAMSAPDTGPIALCTYSGTATGANLIGSDGLSADRAQALLDALASAKDDGSGVPAMECFAENPDATLILRGGEPMAWAFNTGCSESGVDLGDGEVLPMSTKVMQALYGYAQEPTGSGDGGVVTQDPDTSVSNDGTVVPPDTGAPDSGAGSGTSGSSGGADPGAATEVPPASPSEPAK